MSEYAVEWDGHFVSLPPVVPSAGRDEFVWIQKSWEGELEYASRPDVTRSKRGVFVDVRLVPRPDNGYNGFAVSISRPPNGNLSLDDCHLGYLLDWFLDRVGMETLHALARYSDDGQIRATGLMAPGSGLIENLCLPSGKKLRRACEQFFKHVNTPSPHLRPTLQTLLGVEPYGVALTRDDLVRLRTFGNEPPSIEGVYLRSQSFGDRTRPRVFTVHEATSDRYLGECVGDMLLLDDERTRRTVLAKVSDIPIREPIPEYPLSARDRWAHAHPPNAFIRSRTGGLDVRATNPDRGSSRQTFAQWNPRTKALYVEDQQLVGAAVAHLARVGLEVSSVNVPTQSWKMEDEFYYRERRDLSDRNGGAEQVEQGWDAPPSWAPVLPKSLMKRLPQGLIRGREIRWSENVSPSSCEVPDEPHFRVHESFLHARDGLFPERELTGAIVRCRFCGDAASEFKCLGVSDRLAYCHNCFHHFDGSSGFSTLEQAALAVRLLSEREFGGAQLLERELDELRLDVDSPKSSDEIDLLLVARMAVRRGRWPWTKVLHGAGLLKDGYRASRGVVMVAADDHLCMSMLEKAVDDFMFKNGIEHSREPHYPFDPELNPRTLRRGDFLLADGTLVEVWGFPKDAVYAAKMAEKRKLAARHNMQLVGVTAADLPRLAEIFASWLRPGASEEPTWLPPTPQAAKRKRTADPGDDPRGGDNSYSKARREERLERCAVAMAHQSAGLSKREIATLMGVSYDTISPLLRDGKFYADPSTDRARYELAELAAMARADGMRKAEFRAAMDLTGAKALEAWKDADVVFGSKAPRTEV